jgi:hypothetical protein
MLFLLSLNKIGKRRVLHLVNAEGCFPNTAALAPVEDRPASKARLGPCPPYILTHHTQKNILPGEDVRGVSFETRGVGPREDGAIPICRNKRHVVLTWKRGGVAVVVAVAPPGRGGGLETSW